VLSHLQQLFNADTCHTFIHWLCRKFEGFNQVVMSMSRALLYFPL
jgi:hypothetical protein